MANILYLAAHQNRSPSDHLTLIRTCIPLLVFHLPTGRTEEKGPKHAFAPSWVHCCCCWLPSSTFSGSLITSAGSRPLSDSLPAPRASGPKQIPTEEPECSRRKQEVVFEILRFVFVFAVVSLSRA